MTVTGDGWSSDQPYTGQEYKKETYTFGNVVEGETATITYSIAGTEVGPYTGAFGDDFKVVKADGTDSTANYNLTEKTPGKLTIVKSDIAQYVTLTPTDVEKVYDGKTYAAGTARATDSNGKTVKIEYSVNGTDWTEDPTTITATDVADSVTVQVRASVPESYEGYVTGTQKLTITKRPVTVTITGNTDSKVYNGSEQKIEGYTVGIVDELYSEDYITFSGTDVAKGTDVGTYDMGLKKDQFTNTNDNFDVTFTVTDGSLEITPVTSKVTVTITENSGTEKYDGAEKTVTGYKAESDNELYAATTDNFTFSGNDSVKGTDAGTYDMELKPEDFANTNKNFSNVEFVIVDGTLKINPREVTLTSADDSKPYDGTALTNHNVEVGGDGFAKGEGATYTFTGTQTEVGSSPNAFSFKLNEGTKVGNYVIAKTEGTLEVTPLTDKVTVTITENSGEYEYDGTEKTVKGYGVTNISNPLYKVDDFTFSGNDTVKGTDAGTYDMELKPTDFANTNKNFSNVEFVIVDGQLVITPADITPPNPEDPDDPTVDYRFVVSQPEDVVYNGKEQKQPVTVTDKTTGKTLVEGTDFEYAYSEDVTNVGEVTVTVKGKGNYSGEVSRTYQITPAEYTVTTGSAEKVYDGTPLTKDEATINGLVNGETATVTATGTITNVGSTENTYTLTWDGTAKESNYKHGDDSLGTLTVTKKSIEDPDDPGNPDTKNFTVTGPEDTKYNGQEQKQPVTVTDTKTGKDLVEGTDCTITYSEDVTNAGTVTVTVTGIGNYSGSFEVTYKITPREVTLTSESATQVYNGSALTRPEVTVGGDGFVEGEATAKATGSQTEVGSTTNTIVVTEGEGFKADNYKITKDEGTLTVTQKSIEDPDDPGKPNPTLEITGPEDTVYNGLEQKQPVTVKDTETGKDLVEGTDFELSYSNDVTNVGEVTVTVTGKGNYKGEFELTYKITPAPLTIKTSSAEKVYDGTALTSEDYEITGLVNGETLGVDVTGSQTLVGTSNNTIKITWADKDQTISESLTARFTLLALDIVDGKPTAVSTNYALNVELGTLTVTDGDDDNPVDPDNVIVKTHEDKEYGLGDTVEFTITATNIYDEAKTMTITEMEGVTITGESVFENVEPGATVTTTATYTVTEDDILAGSFTNDVTVSFDGGKDFTNEDDVDIEDKNPHITVTKTVTSTATSYAAVDTIEYKIVVENDGNLTLTDVKVTDALTGDEWTVEELKPGDKKEFTAKYTVTEADANAGKVVNTATATGTDPEGNKPGVTPGTAETPITKPALPKTGDASSLFPAVVTAAMGLMSMAAGIRSRRRRWEEEL